MALSRSKGKDILVQQERGLILVPNRLKLQKIQVYSVGQWQPPLKWERDMEKAMKHSFGLVPQRIIAIDATNFNGARENVWGHIGSGTRVLQNIWEKDNDQLNQVMVRVAEALIDAEEPLENIVVFCDWGKHRSVGVAFLLREAMHIVLPNVDLPEVEHLSRTYWSKWKCGWRRCAECDDMDVWKQAVICKASDMFKRAWSRSMRSRQ